MAKTIVEHIETRAGEKGGLITIPDDLARVGGGIQPTLPTGNDPYILKVEMNV